MMMICVCMCVCRNCMRYILNFLLNLKQHKLLAVHHAQYPIASRKQRVSFWSTPSTVLSYCLHKITLIHFVSTTLHWMSKSKLVLYMYICVLYIICYQLFSWCKFVETFLLTLMRACEYSIHPCLCVSVSVCMIEPNWNYNHETCHKDSPSWVLATM